MSLFRLWFISIAAKKKQQKKNNNNLQITCCLKENQITKLVLNYF